MKVYLYKKFEKSRTCGTLLHFSYLHERGNMSICHVDLLRQFVQNRCYEQFCRKKGGMLMATVGQIMPHDLHSITEEEPIQEAAKMMYAKRIGSLFVTRAEEFVGIITETDVVQAVAEHLAEVGQLTVKDLMSSPIITIDRKMAPHYARDLMADRKIRHLAVTEEGKIVGIISVRDLLAYFKTISKDLEE